MIIKVYINNKNLGFKNSYHTNANDYNRAMLIFICRLQFLFARRQKCVSASKGWRTVFGRFAECKFSFARRQKCESAPKAGARSLEDLPSAKIHNLSDFSKQIKKKYPQKH